MITVIRVGEDGLARTQWGFLNYDNHLRCVWRSNEQRPNRRHKKWNIIEKWDWYNPRDSAKGLPEVPDDVILEALSSLRIRVFMWDQEQKYTASPVGWKLGT